MTLTTVNAKTPTGLSRVGLLAMATASGIAVANIYYNQPMLGIIEADFPGQSATALVPTATQLDTLSVSSFFCLLAIWSTVASSSLDSF